MNMLLGLQGAAPKTPILLTIGSFKINTTETGGNIMIVEEIACMKRVEERLMERKVKNINEFTK